MATISVAGPVVCKQGDEPVTFKQFDSGDSVASFSIADREYVYTKPGTESAGQFYRVEIRGKTAQIASERLKRGDYVVATGQLVQREYNGKTYLDVRNSRLTFVNRRDDNNGSTSSGSEVF